MSRCNTEVIAKVFINAYKRNILVIMEDHLIVDEESNMPQETLTLID